MKYSTKNNSTRFRPVRRTAALLCAALVGLSLAAARTSAQVTGPLGPPQASPPAPTPFQSPLFHSGGGPGAVYPADTTSAPYLDPLLDPLQGQLQGTPTEVYAGNITQIPSFLLGNYDPTQPPADLINGGTNGAGGVNRYFPNHFADGSALSWAAPFAYTLPGTNVVTVDDRDPAPVTTPAPVGGFTASGGFVAINNATGTYPAAGTATSGEYLRLPPGATGSAVWTLYQPTGGTYSVYFHIPNDLPDVNGVAEPRSTTVQYSIAVRDNINGNVTATATATVSQTEANDTQFLAGPFQMPNGGAVTVTLTRDTVNNAASLANDFLVADSMTLQPTTGDVQSAPTAITHDLFPAEFESLTHPLQYWGIFVPPSTSLAATVQQTGGTSITTTALPDTTGAQYNDATTANQGTLLLKSGNTAAALATDPLTGKLRRIRQLVYFGRSDPAASIGRTVDDIDATNFTGSGTLVTTATTASASTASNNEYRKSAVIGGAAPNPVLLPTPAATWTIPFLTAGNYFVSVHIPAVPGAGPYTEVRANRVYYSVSVNGGIPVVISISQVVQGTDALVNLPTGPLTVPANGKIVVSMYTQGGLPVNNAAIADSVTASTGTGQGAIYCVDGFNGGVVWRYETPGSANGASSPVFSSPAIVRMNVIVTPPVYGANNTITTPAVYANRLVVVVGDNNGLVYCLDAIGNGDGTSNADVLAKDANGNPVAGQPVVVPQPAYGGTYGAVATPLLAGTLATTAAATAHVGTTGTYWVYRPSVSQPKYISGINAGTVKTIDPTTDLPVPAAFNTASPNIFVDPTINTTLPTASNSIIYIGNSNGVLYALDGGGAPINGATQVTYNATGDTFDVSQDLQQPGVFPKTVAIVPSAQPRWWFSVRGVDPNGPNNTSSADIESAPAIHVTASTTLPVTYTPTVYIGSAHEQEVTSNVGRLYALNGLYGPSSNNGRFSPITQPDPALPNYTGPGSFNYNVGQVPQTNSSDTLDWSFPDGNTTKPGANNPLANFKHQSSTGLARPALGNMTGSPVVFTNLNETVNNPTRIYIAANSGLEYPATARPDATQTGRVWAVNLDGSVGSTTRGSIGTGTTSFANGVWAYPLANNPNDAAFDSIAEPYAPIGAFLRGTPAIGFVQFPAIITLGDAAGSTYTHPDAVNPTTIRGASVPMLYIGTAGVNDSALYAVDINGGMITPNTSLTNDQRTIFRLVTPDGSIYQSSPALITNATNNGAVRPDGSGLVAVPGNGGSVYVVAGNTLYDYGATPISNPFYSTAPGGDQPFPLYRLNMKLPSTAGPISSPSVAGANINDITSAAFTTYTIGGVTYNTTDWVYVGDSSTGFCQGFTPFDTTYGGIGVGLNQIVPFNPIAAAGGQVLTASIQTFLVKDKTSAESTKGVALPFGPGSALQVYEWGESAAIRFSNVAPPNPVIAATGKDDPNLYIHDTRLYPDVTVATPADPIPFYSSDGTAAQTVTFNLSDFDATTNSVLQQDNGSVQQNLIVLPQTPPDGYTIDGATVRNPDFPDVTTNLVANNGKRYLGTYTYTIGDGSGRNNTPGARRRLLNVRQVVTQYLYDGQGNYTKSGTAIIGGDASGENLVTVKKPDGTYGFTQASKVAAVDQPTFGILNPLAVRGGGVPLLPANSTVAVPIGDETGPFRSIKGDVATLPVFSAPTTGDVFGLQALSNGNDILTYAPPSSSGVAGSPGPSGNPTALPNSANDPLAPAPTITKVIVTATGLIPDNKVGDNSEAATTGSPTGVYANAGTDGLSVTTFGGYSLNAFDRSALINLAQTLRLKATIPASTLNVPASGGDGLFWNSNVVNDNGHDSTVNYLPWETAPTPYSIGINTSSDYPNIAPGNVAQNAIGIVNGATAGDLSSNSVSLPQGQLGGGQTLDDRIKNRTVYGDPVQIKITVPHHQSANQQLYQELPNIAYTPTGGQSYSLVGQVAPLDNNGANQISSQDNVFPMGYITTKRLFVPSSNGNYNSQRPYRDVRVYTGVPINMQTSIATTTTDIGRVPAAFGVQTEQYQPAVNPLGYFTPYSGINGNTLNPYLAYFKPLEVHNDGNVNLLNAHFDQQAAGANSTKQTVHLYSDAASLLSVLDGFDIYGTTGPRGGTLPGTLLGTRVPEQQYLIRTSLDSDIFRAYGQNPFINSDPHYPGATFHKPAVGSDQPSILSVPDAPESYVPGASLPASPNPVAPSALNGVFKSAPFVSIAFPFGTPVGTYTMSPAGALRLFEGLDTAAPNAYSLNPTAAGSGNPSILYPPKYGGAVGGSATAPNQDPTDAGQPLDTNGKDEDVYNGLQPLSTTGTQLSGTVIEQRLTDGFTYGAVPMIDGGPAKSANGNNPALSTPDFAPAAFRDLASGNLSVYWTSARGGGYGIYGANLPFIPNPAANTNGQGYFLPTYPTGQWWNPFPLSLQAGTNSGLSVTTTPTGTDYAFTVNVAAGTPYSNTLYAYPVTPGNGALSAGVPVTPATDASQVKYGVKGLYAKNFTNTLWAFWTASTRGRTALYYSPQSAWGTTSAPALPPTLLPVPAGLTAVADASPLILTAPVPSASGAPTYQDVAEVTYSGTGPDGNADLYVSRYLPHGTTAATGAAQLDQVPFPAVTENLTATTTGSVKTGWFQARDVAWSRTGALNVSVLYTDANGPQNRSLLYGTSTPFAPQFTKAIYDKASGYLVLTGVQVPIILTTVNGTQQYTTNTVYVDSGTGRIRFSPALLPTQTFPTIRATFSPMARRLTTDTRADVAPVTFLDDKQKPNDAASVPNSMYTASVEADRRWTIWRKSGVAGVGSTATLYFKTQRLTAYLPSAVDTSKTMTITLRGTTYSGPVDVDSRPAILDPKTGAVEYPASSRLLFPIASGAEGAFYSVTYTPLGGTTAVTAPTVADTIQWQDEVLANDASYAPPADTAAALDTVIDTPVPIQTATNENNVTAFLDPYAGLPAANGGMNSHKVWLFWNSTRNGTADIYSETIDPRFSPAPTIP